MGLASLLAAHALISSRIKLRVPLRQISCFLPGSATESCLSAVVEGYLTKKVGNDAYIRGSIARYFVL